MQNIYLPNLKEKKRGTKTAKTSWLFDTANIILVLLITIVVTYPLYFCIIASFSDPNSVSLGQTALWIRNFTLDSYKYVFKEDQIWIGYRNSFFYTAAGTLYNLLLTIPAAYVLTKKYLPIRNAISWFFFITMYFSGGMIPTYIWTRDLGLINTPWVLVIGAGVSCYNLIVTRQYFDSSIPNELYEAAYIDGASEYQSFFKIALPLSKPILAVMALFYGVGHWNSYYSALLYITKKDLYPLQLVLRNILIVNQVAMNNIEMSDTNTITYLLYLARMAEGMKYAIIFIASAPLLMAYPLVQKHFTKGVMLGSVKG